MTPTWRKPFGMFLILLLICVWSGLVVSQADRISALPAWAQIPVYFLAGTIWILPLKPLLRWMELGEWRAR
jgi:hypothetical protein